MKKTYLLPFIIALSFLISGIAHAQVSSTSTSAISEIKQKISDLKQKAEQVKIQMKAEISSAATNTKNQQSLKNPIEIKIGKKLDKQKIKIASEFENVIQNLEDLVARISSRIAKMDSDGIDTTQSKSLLEAAKSKIDSAKTEMTNLENMIAGEIPPVSTSTSEENQRMFILKDIMAQSGKAKTAINIARKAILDAVNALKSEMSTVKISTSTEATSTNN